MDSQVDTIIHKLKNHEYVDNRGIPEALDSWGIGFQLTKDIPSSIFRMHRLLRHSIHLAKKHLHEPEQRDNSPPQLILDYKKGNW